MLYKFPVRLFTRTWLITKIQISNLIISAVFFLAGCNQSSLQHLDSLSKNSPLDSSYIFDTGIFKILGKGTNRKTDSINVYIEGDGRAWADPWTVSSDPTPADPVAFKLALEDKRPLSFLYLARPCQYLTSNHCRINEWTTGRYSQKIIDAYNTIFDRIRKEWAVTKFNLYAYSGGATIALLLGIQRKDINRITTFAPLLDHKKWTAYHAYSPLTESLYPLDHPQVLRKILQNHYMGMDDTEIPLDVSADYFKSVPESSTVNVHKLTGYTHYSDWPALWKVVLNKTYNKNLSSQFE